MDPSIMARTYDATHVRAIHQYLFQDVYEWAGEYRTLNMTKVGRVRGFADVKAGEIDRYLADVQRLVEHTEWASLDRVEFGRAAAAVFAHLNQAHPFREGNGRTSKVFMEYVAQQSRYTLDFGLVDDKEWNMASELSRPDIGACGVVPATLVPVFEGIARPRSAAVLAHDDRSSG
ncbi:MULTISPECIES: Fic family protein [unclassified Actinomyces]|nr:MULTISPECIES: Fic family protein [unclassified Actinomyces]